MIIDAHHHLWKYSHEDYPWTGKEPGALGRDYLAKDLWRLLEANSVQGTVVVQARECFEENLFLLEQARLEPRIKGIVGWVGFRQRHVPAQVEALAGEPLIKGVRHILQAEPEMKSFIDLPTFKDGLRAIERAGLRFDVLIQAAQLHAAIRLVDQHPNLPMVVDHVAKPCISGAPERQWVEGMQALALRENVCCKLSGMVTEVHGGEWTTGLLRPYFETVLEAFGPRRMMFGSDWPVCLSASSYERWLETVLSLISGLSPDERERILSGTALEFYGLKRE